MLIISLSLFPKSQLHSIFSSKNGHFSILMVHAKLWMFIQDVKF